MRVGLLVDSTSLVTDAGRSATRRHELRARMADEGYLFARDLIPRSPLQAALQAFVRVLGEEGWIDANGDPGRLTANAERFCVDPQAEYRRVYRRIYQSPAFHALKHAVVPVAQLLFDDDVLVHPRPIGRIIFPVAAGGDADYTTPAHQDYVTVQGSQMTFTAWLPLTEVSIERGPLAVLPGSHRSGVLPASPALGAGGEEIAVPADAVWRASHMHPGDVLLFHSMTVHRGLPNRTNEIRLSMDSRYQSVSAPISERSLSYDWEALYANWPEPDHKYYWKKLKLDIVRYDRGHEQRRDDAAVTAARLGDKRTVSALQRMAVDDPDPERRNLARSMIASFGEQL